MDWKATDALLPLLKAAKQHPSALVILGTTCAAFVIQWHYTGKSNARLIESQRRMDQSIEASLATMKGLLCQLDLSASNDFRNRKEMVRLLDVQNVEQTRSLSRLEHALRACSPSLNGMPSGGVTGEGDCQPSGNTDDGLH